MSKNYYSMEHKIELFSLSNQFSERKVCEIFSERHQSVPIPSQSCINRLKNKFKKYGSLENIKPTGRPKSTITEEKEIDVLARLEISPIKSVRKLGDEASISKTSAHEILMKHNYHPYKVRPIHRLLEGDAEKRMEFCQIMTEHLDNNPQFSENIIFTDEAIFYLNGRVNRQNTRYWATENPHWADDPKMLNHPRVMVWCGIWDNRIIGPFFFDNTVTSKSYLKLLEEKVWPEISLDPNINQAFWQQDGAPAHYATDVRNWLNHHFNERWIGRGGPIEWSPMSPDFSMNDFFLWGHIKGIVYCDHPQNLDQLKSNIISACASIPDEMFINSRLGFEMCLKHCIMAGGEQFEHLLK